MNSQLLCFARKTLKEGLSKCSNAQHELFKRMYAKDGNLELDIETVVDNMEDGKLDWAMQQVERTLLKNNTKITNAV